MHAAITNVRMVQHARHTQVHVVSISVLVLSVILAVTARKVGGLAALVMVARVWVGVRLEGGNTLAPVASISVLALNVILAATARKVGGLAASLMLARGLNGC